MLKLPINLQLETIWGKLKESSGGLVILKPIFKKYYTIITLVNRILYKITRADHNLLVA